MNQQINVSPNQHIKEYLDYYCSLPYSSNFAILLKGKWGSGKTWFINQYCEDLRKRNQKPLYISLNGVTDYSQIEDSIFQQTNPVLASKEMVLAGKIMKGVLKGTLKIDLGDDGKDDGTWNPTIPDRIMDDIKKFFKDSNFSLLIFDDLERCSISIDNILGYINSFVESRNLKVVIVANEDDIITNQDKINPEKKRYKKIKEKLIGKTFEIITDIPGTLNEIVKKINNQNIQGILVNHIDLIQELFKKADSTNLRILNQISLDFERVFNVLPEKAKNEPKLLKDILELLIIFSIEISYARLEPQDIGQLEVNLTREIVDLQVEKHSFNTENTNQQNNIKESKFLEIFNKYYHYYSYYSTNYLILNKPFPDLLWWEEFLNKGIVNKNSLENSIENSKYFQNESTPNWQKLMRFRYIDNDNQFKKILEEVYSEYENTQFEDIGIIKHITGLFLFFSDVGLSKKSKLTIIDEAKQYIDKLKNNGKLDIKYINTRSDYMNKEFFSEDDPMFKEFVDYINKLQKQIILQSIPNNVRRLLDIMQTNVYEFRSIICVTAPSKDLEIEYRESPIFNHILPKEFVQVILKISNEHRHQIFSYIRERYSVHGIVEKLVDEREFFIEVQKLLLAEASNRQGELSGFLLEELNKCYLENIITNLEQNKSEDLGSNSVESASNE